MWLWAQSSPSPLSLERMSLLSRPSSFARAFTRTPLFVAFAKTVSQKHHSQGPADPADGQSTGTDKYYVHIPPPAHFHSPTRVKDRNLRHGITPVPPAPRPGA